MLFLLFFSVLATITEMPHQSHPLWKTWAGTNAEAHLLSNTRCQQTVSKPQAEACRYGKGTLGSQLHTQASREGQGKSGLPTAGHTSFPFGSLTQQQPALGTPVFCNSIQVHPLPLLLQYKDPLCKNTLPQTQKHQADTSFSPSLPIENTSSTFPECILTPDLLSKAHQKSLQCELNLTNVPSQGCSLISCSPSHLPVSPFTFLSVSLSQVLSSQQLSPFPGGPLLCWPRNQAHLCCPTPIPAALTQLRLTALQREWLYMGCDYRISDACHPWCKQL